MKLVIKIVISKSFTLYLFFLYSNFSMAKKCVMFATRPKKTLKM